MPIHTFGDSHAIMGWNTFPGIDVHSIGPVLCYSFGREKKARLDVVHYGVKEGDTVIFCFGEIDCRCHINKYVSEERPYQDIIDDIVSNYFEAIRENVSDLKIKTCVYNVVPPIEKYNTVENPEYPYLGSDEDRKGYVLYFNEQLKKLCQKYEYVFFDVYDKYTDDRGFLLKALSDGNVHIAKGRYLQDFLYTITL